MITYVFLARDCKTRTRTGECGRRMANADGGWRMADGGRRMGLFFLKKNRMFILLNLLLNCYLLRNASFGYFSFFFVSLN